MCGIVGYVEEGEAREVLLSGLMRLEMRGYDSAGICLHADDRLTRTRVVGGPSLLEPLTEDATSGIGHTRWATHGSVCEANAHPFWGCADGEIAIALNGIVENFKSLKERLVAEGHCFCSETDAEVVSHLVESVYDGDLVAVVRAVASELEGHFALLVMHRDHPDLLVGTRRRVPLVAGVGERELVLASSIVAFHELTDTYVPIADDEIVVLRADASLLLLAPDRREVKRDPERATWEVQSSGLGDFETHMLKEIHEQPAAIAATLRGRADARSPLPELDCPALADPGISRLVIVGCGTSLNAGSAGRLMLERWGGIFTTVEIASEWSESDPIVGPESLVVAISQSGETADTLAAVRLARAMGAPTLAITNARGSQITREADAVLLTHAGHETSVAATKTFSSQVSALALLALRIGVERGTLDREQASTLCSELLDVPAAIRRYLAAYVPVAEIAERLADASFFVYLSRGVGVPVCLEGALKMREVTYIPTEAYPAGELKHGPIALIEPGTPVVCVAIDGPSYDKLLSNIQEVRARGAHVIAIATDGNEAIQHLLAKTVTVE